jgi:predicted PurR-regulated permease PerM
MAERRSKEPRAANPRTPQDAGILIPVGGLLLLAALGYAVESVLSPFVLLAALIYFLFPWRKQMIPGRLIGLGVFLCAVWALVSLFGILVPFLLSFLLAYLLNPIVEWLEERRIPRWVGAGGSVLLLAAIGVTAALFLFPAAFRQFEGIIGGLRSIVSDFIALVNSGALVQFFERYGIAGDRVREFVATQMTPRLEGILKALFEALFGFLSSISSLVLHLVNIVIIPFVVFYLLKDYPLVTESLRRLIPARRREGAHAVLGLVDEILGSYFRGALIVALLQGAIAGVGLWFIGVDYALVLGIMTGVLNFVPYVGLLTSLAVALIVASFSGEPVLLKILAVVLLYLSQKLLEATVFGPRIVGSRVGLHPVLLILCLLVFGYFLGFVGLLIAVPATALIIALVGEWREAG